MKHVKPAKPAKPAKFVWTIQIEVDEVWIADGYNLTKDRAIYMVLSDLSSATSDEVCVKVLSKPSNSSIANAQGYSSIKEWKASYSY